MKDRALRVELTDNVGVILVAVLAPGLDSIALVLMVEHVMQRTPVALKAPVPVIRERHVLSATTRVHINLPFRYRQIEIKSLMVLHDGVLPHHAIVIKNEELSFRR